MDGGDASKVMEEFFEQVRDFLIELLLLAQSRAHRFTSVHNLRKKSIALLMACRRSVYLFLRRKNLSLRNESFQSISSCARATRFRRIEQSKMV